jgi:hypothetical protein
MTRFCTLVIICLALVGCKECNNEPPPPSALVLVDFSASAKQLLPDYQKYLNEVITKIPHGGRIVVAKIQASTLARFEPFVNAQIPGKPGIMDVEKDVEDSQRRIRRQIQTAVDSVFSNPVFSPGTSILAGLGLVKETFPNAPRRVLVLLSDMLHASTDFSLENVRLTDALIDQTLGRLKQQEGKIPDLKGVAVYVAGATAKTDEQYNQIKEFWEKLFAQSGAELLSYSRTLLNFDL